MPTGPWLLVQALVLTQARFTEALMKDKAKLDFPADRIFSTAETGQPKSEVLKQLEHTHPNTSYHFVEDKLGTLDKVCVFFSIGVPDIGNRELRVRDALAADQIRNID